MPIQQFPIQAIVSTLATVKVFDTHANTVNPPGAVGTWFNPYGYDDSSWATSSDPVITNTFNWKPLTIDYCRQGYGPLPTPKSTTAFPTTPANGSTYIMRWHIQVPDSTWYPLLLENTNWTSGGYGYALNSQIEAVFPYKSRHVNLRFGFNGGDLIPGTEFVLSASDQWFTAFGFNDFWTGFRILFYQPDATQRGTVFSWGTPASGVSDKGVLGTGDTGITHPTPTTAAGGRNDIVKVVSNGQTTLILGIDGSIYTCGDNSTGLLGIGHTDTLGHPTITKINLPANTGPVIDISIGQDLAMVLGVRGQPYGWGPNAHGSFGNGTTSSILNPTLVPIFSPTQTGLVACAISAGKNFSATGGYNGPSSRSGTMSVSGDNTFGQLGNGTAASTSTMQFYLTPSEQNNNDVIIKQISAGDDQLFVLTDYAADAPFAFQDSHSYLAGRGDYGSLGPTGWFNGTGPNKIISTLRLDSGSFKQIEQCGTLTYMAASDAGTQDVIIYGDGVPNGNGDDGFNGTDYGHGPTLIYNTGAGFMVLSHHGSQPFLTFVVFGAVAGLSACSGGSQNPLSQTPYVAGASERVAAGAFGLELPFTNTFRKTYQSATIQTTWANNVFPPTTNIPDSQGFGWPPDNLPQVLPTPRPNQITVSVTTRGMATAELWAWTLQGLDANGHVLTGPSQVLSSPSLSGNTNYTASKLIDSSTVGFYLALAGPIPNDPTFFYDVTITLSGVGTSDGLLYTWGYGANDQMGSGADPTVNATPKSTNGLTTVINSAVANGVMFAIANGYLPSPVVSIAGAQVIG